MLKNISVLGEIPVEKGPIKYGRKKSLGAASKRVSVRKLPVLHSIDETCEGENAVFKSPIKTQDSFTPRRSLRLSAKKSEKFGDMKAPIEEECLLISPVTPRRRSQRVLQSVQNNFQFDDDILSPFKGKSSGYYNLNSRNSIRLINFDSDENDKGNTSGKSKLFFKQINYFIFFRICVCHVFTSYKIERKKKNICLICFHTSH